MTAARKWGLLLITAITAVPAVVFASGLSVNVWADRGADAVYEPGDRVQVRARASDDANLLVYDIDAEGNVHVLFPYRGRSGYVDGRQTFMIPANDTQDELVVRGPVGQGYIVAIASRAPFRDLPWYLRPYDPQAEGVGYVGGPENAGDEDDFVTREGRIVGDPFVAIERIRREVVSDPDDRDGVATAYVSYYVHDHVRYPRYVCNDCHRPGHYAWWDGFDPYYASCSVVDFRVNFGWFWGTPYWSSCVPYYVYVVRPSCPPYYQPWAGNCFSSWDGWRRWNTLWGSHLTRYKPAAPPVAYIPPSRYKWDRRWQSDRPAPPGFLTAGGSRGRIQAPRMPQSGDPLSGVVARTDWRPGGELRRPIERAPLGEAPRQGDATGRFVERPRRGVERSPVGDANGEGGQTYGGRREGRPATEPPRNEPPVNVRREGRPGWSDSPPRNERPAPPRNEPPVNVRREGRPGWSDSPPRNEQPRFERPAPRNEQPRFERPAPPRNESPRNERPAPRNEQPRFERPAPSRNDRPAPSQRGDQKGRGDRGDKGDRGGRGGGH